MQDPDQLAQYIFGQSCNPGNVAPRLGQAGDKPVGDWIVDARHDDWNCLRRPLQRAGARRVSNHDHVDRLVYQFAGHGVQSVHVAIGVDGSILNVLSFHPAEIAHPLFERCVGFGGTDFRSERNPTYTTDGRGRLSVAVQVREKQTNAACQ